MSKIRVGIDCDQVLRDFVGQTIKLAEEHGKHISRPHDWDYIDKNKIDGKSMRWWIWESGEWIERIFVDAPTLPFAKKGYDAFIEDDMFEVHIVTSQYKDTEHYTETWLDENGFTDHENTHFLFDKLKAPVQVLIDDKPSHVEAFRDHAREGYLVTASYNQDSSFQPRVDNLYDAYLELKERYEDDIWKKESSMMMGNLG